MNPDIELRLGRLALAVREHIIRMSSGGGCFIGASLSCADLLVHLYDRVVDLAPDRLDDEDRDYVLLSKGHDVPALYGTLVELGYMARERLANHLSPDDHIYWHPNTKMPGIEFHSGSLGHGLAVGAGIAMDMKLRGSKQRTFVILGDGELDEGSVWETMLVASAHHLDSLVAIVDRNGFQANIETESLIPLEPLMDKFQAFGWRVMRVDGHDFGALEEAHDRLKETDGRPSILIADTVRGRGLPSIERRADRWFVRFSDDEVTALLEELHGGAEASLTSETLVVR